MGPPVAAAVALGPAPPERKRATFPGDDRRRVDRDYLRFAGVGVQFGLSILFLTLAGIWIDGKLGTAPLFTVVLLFVGFVAATVSLVHRVLGTDDHGGDRGGRKGPRGSGEPPGAPGGPEGRP